CARGDIVGPTSTFHYW
nr:immunoglobulin heavy chain junction region [Macaca mulatta]